MLQSLYSQCLSKFVVNSCCFSLVIIISNLVDNLQLFILSLDTVVTKILLISEKGLISFLHQLIQFILTLFHQWLSQMPVNLSDLERDLLTTILLLQNDLKLKKLFYKRNLFQTFPTT